MIDDQLVLRVERLRDSVEGLRDEIRSRYKKPARQVVSDEVRETAALLAERWLVEIGAREDVRAVLGEELVADLSVQFQRLITYSEAATVRHRYDAALRTILTNFRTQVVIPLKQKRGSATRHYPAVSITKLSDAKTAFIGQSFSATDDIINRAVRSFLESIGIQVITGERPVAGSVSEKIKARIEGADIFIGIFTRRERLVNRHEWSTSAWVIDEKAYAIAKDKKLVLIKEKGVQSIGGLQGDYEYLEFDRNRLEDLVLALLQIFRD